MSVIRAPNQSILDANRHNIQSYYSASGSLEGACDSIGSQTSTTWEDLSLPNSWRTNKDIPSSAIIANKTSNHTSFSKTSGRLIGIFSLLHVRVDLIVWFGDSLKPVVKNGHLVKEVTRKVKTVQEELGFMLETNFSLHHVPQRVASSVSSETHPYPYFIILHPCIYSGITGLHVNVTDSCIYTFTSTNYVEGRGR